MKWDFSIKFGIHYSEILKYYKCNILFLMNLNNYKNVFHNICSSPRTQFEEFSIILKPSEKFEYYPEVVFDDFIMIE